MNTLFCSLCQTKFPLFIGPSRWVRRGFLQMPDLRCAHCGAVCRSKVAWRRAIWAWPIGALATILLLSFMEKALYPGFREAQLTGLYSALRGVLGGLTGGLAIRSGFTLTALTAEESSRRVSPFAGIGAWLVIVAALFVFWITGSYLRGPLAAFLSLATGILVYSAFYFLTGKRNALDSR